MHSKRPGKSVAPSPVESLIHVIRGQKVMLDADLAVLYRVSTSAFNQTVRRNAERFPPDFMFRLTPQESAEMRSQTETGTDHRQKPGQTE